MTKFDQKAISDLAKRNAELENELAKSRVELSKYQNNFYANQKIVILKSQLESTLKQKEALNKIIEKKT